jgi:elongation factor 2
MGETLCDPSVGNVAFGSGKDQWAFTLTKFARLYSKKFGISE